VIKNTMIAENDAHRNSILLIMSPLLNLFTFMNNLLENIRLLGCILGPQLQPVLHYSVCIL